MRVYSTVGRKVMPAKNKSSLCMTEFHLIGDRCLK